MIRVSKNSIDVTFASGDENQSEAHKLQFTTVILRKKKCNMEHYSETQMKQDLATLEIPSGSNLTIKFLTLKFKKLAKIHHPDRKGGKKEAFQKLKNAYDNLIAMLDDGQFGESDEDYEKEFFKTSNFPFEKKNCFVVVLENKLSDHWEYILKDLYGPEKILETGGIQFKIDTLTLSFYNKPKKDNKTKVLIQGKNKDAIVEYVFETLPKVYRRVSEIGRKELQTQRKEISCDNCEYKSKDIPLLQDHIEIEHLIPYRKKVQQKRIAAYKCEECTFSVPTRSSLRTHVNSKHKNRKQSNYSLKCDNNPIKINLELSTPARKKEESKANNEAHPAVSQVVEDLLCQVCDILFDSKIDVRNHLATTQRKG